MKKLLFGTLLLLASIFNVCGATITVTNTNDSGSGSLRDAVANAVNGDVIRFSPSLIAGGSATITLTSHIAMHKGITIKGLYNANDTLYITSVNSSLFVSDLTNATNKNIVYDSVVFLNSLNSAIKCYESNSLTIQNSSFKNCQSVQGGAIFLGYLSQTISANLIVHNSTFENCSATTQRGGAILIQSKSSINAEITNSTFIDNQSIMDGGAVCAESILNGSPVFIQVDNSTFYSNHASSGADISIKSQYSNGNCQLELINSSFVQATGFSSIYFGYDVNASTPSSITYGSSIVSPNTTNLIAFGVPNNPFTDMNSLGYNVFNSTLNLGGTVASDQTGITPAQLNISAPAINGGTTKTCYLNAPSVAINTGNPLDMSIAQNGPIMEGIRDVGACESTPMGDMLSFDGQNDGVYGNAINTGGDYFTLELMVKPSTSSDPLAYLIYNGIPGVNGYGLAIDPSTNEVLLEIGGSPLESSSYLLNPGTWTHLVYTYNMGSNKLYANGSLEFSFTSSAIAPPTTNFFLGTVENSQHSFGGDLDEVRVWNRELCLSEIIHHQSCEIHEIMTSLLANYHFNQGLDAMNNQNFTTLDDSSGFSNNLTLDNFALNGTASNWLKGSSIPSFISCTDFQEVETFSTLNNISCVGGNDGFIYLNTVGGQGPYTYDWNPGSISTDTLTDLTAGSYEVVTSDVNGCKTTNTYILEELSNLTSSTYYDSIPCYGSTTTMYIAIDGGLAPYYYNWNTNETTFNVPNVSAGNYSCEVTDSRGCVHTNSLIIPERDSLNANTTTNGLEISAVWNGANTYQWYDCTTNQAINNATNQQFTATANGQYAVLVTDVFGCSKMSNCVTINTVGINEHLMESEVSIYPNPTEKQVQIAANKSIERIKVMDQFGKIVLDIEVGDLETTINFETLQSGIYIIECSLNTHKTNHKIQKM